jgi:molecular chaperone DnaK
MYAAAEADQSAAGGSDGSTGESDDDVVDAEIIDEESTGAEGEGHTGAEGESR